MQIESNVFGCIRKYLINLFFNNYGQSNINYE